MAKKTKTEKALEKLEKKLNGIGNFSYDDSGLYSSYSDYNNQWNNYMNNPEKYGYNKYINDVNELFNQIMNQEKFSYDPQQDQLFQMYKQQYNNQGNRAMRNTMGAAVARSGGYNSSAAQTAAQGTFQGYMDALSNKAAETYQNALDMYRYNQQNTINKFNVARDMNNAGNEAYWNQTNALGQRANSAYNAYWNDKQFQYNTFSDNRNYLSGEAQRYQNQINEDRNYELNKKLYKGK